MLYEHFTSNNPYIAICMCTVYFRWLLEMVVPLVCTSQPLHSNLKCLALCGVQEIAECLQQSLESALPSIYGR